MYSRCDAALRAVRDVFRSIGAFRERPVELDAVWRGDSSNPALLRLLRDVLPQREWTTDDLVEDVLA